VGIDPEEIFDNVPPNWQVVQIEANQEGNSQPYPVLAYVDNDQQVVNNNTFAVCYYNNKWHRLGHSISRDRPVVGKPYMWLVICNLDRVAYTFAQDWLYYASPDEKAAAERNNEQIDNSTNKELSALTGWLHVSSISQPITDTMTQLQPTKTASSDASTIGGNTVMTGITPAEVQQIIRMRMRCYMNP
jgi:hypothetical protein